MPASTPDPEDLTARARIRDAALRQFGERGFEGATTRAIAETAGVSPGLLRHHFGSKEKLREACDEHLVKLITRINEQVGADPSGGGVNYVAASLAALGPYRRYLARALTEGWAEPVFDAMVRMSEQWLAGLDERRSDPPFTGRRARATVGTAMALAVGILHEHVSRGLGADVSGEEGAHLLALTVLDLYSHPWLTPEEAAGHRDALERSRTGAGTAARPTEEHSDE
ncbi:TetR/AcrR family transcriptional regulator [Spongiactinospora rosea]|uniref:TetR/AcrR family transcriptional regulator n=1 Tax=Spongiactinospora rosea TaxID=2248750 RepID=A0A366LSU9_9ACTN|nr:TetR/AcrR family transcriptional regulator [Spongiactinospora rosea]RBQ16690.1 TetR/AcrR family transcriptional regulator [Spongiactinospora rosea]